MKKDTKAVIGIAFAAIVFLLGTFLLLGGAKDHFKRKEIAATGLTVNATITGVHRSGKEKNGYEYYYITYEYYDSNGEIHSGRTSDSYKAHEVEFLSSGDSVLVKYDPNTFDSVEEDYNLYGSGRTSVIVFLVFAILDVFLWVVFIVKGINVLKDKFTSRFGKLTTGNFVLCDGEGMKESPLWYVQFSWTDEKGRVRVDQSPAIYTKKEAEMFEKAKTFKIKVLGKNGIIVSNLGEIKKLAKNSDEDKKEKCKYCGAELKENDKKCSTCGSSGK